MDEAHKLKNAETKMYKSALELRHAVQYCVGLTGEALMIRLQLGLASTALFFFSSRHAHAEQCDGALLRFQSRDSRLPGASVGACSSFCACSVKVVSYPQHMQSFNEIVAGPIARAQEKRREGMSVAEHRRIIAVGDKARTAMRLGPLALHMLRRLKTVELADQLPHKEEVCVYVPLTALQERIYKRILASIDVRTLLGIANAGDPTGPLWRMGRPDEEILPLLYESRRIALMGCVLWVATA